MAADADDEAANPGRGPGWPPPCGPRRPCPGRPPRVVVSDRDLGLEHVSQADELSAGTGSNLAVKPRPRRDLCRRGPYKAASRGVRPSISRDMESSLIFVDIGELLSRPREPRGARNGSQRRSTHSDCPRRLQGVIAGERLPGRLPQTGPDGSFVTGGQGVAGSNPAVPTVLERLCGVYNTKVQQHSSGRPLRHRTERAGPVLRPGGRQARPLKDHDVGAQRGTSKARGRRVCGSSVIRQMHRKSCAMGLSTAPGRRRSTPSCRGLSEEFRETTQVPRTEVSITLASTRELRARPKKTLSTSPNRPSRLSSWLRFSRPTNIVGIRHLKRLRASWNIAAASSLLGILWDGTNDPSPKTAAAIPTGGTNTAAAPAAAVATDSPHRVRISIF